MIYIDSSVVLAQLLAQGRVPPIRIWEEAISSRLLEYEVWNVIHRKRLTNSHAEVAGDLLRHVDFIEMDPAVLARALDPFPRPVRALDALHLASALYVAEREQKLQLATYDREMSTAATAIGLTLFEV
jgi:hypothetical protein